MREVARPEKVETMFEAVACFEIWQGGEIRVGETVLATTEDLSDAVAAARVAREEYIGGSETGYAYWLVRKPGATLAAWIADSRSSKEFTLDLTTGELVESA